MNDGKTLLLTGASSDVGMCLMKKIAGRYDTIWAHYWHSVPQWDNIQTKNAIIPIQADFSDLDSTKNLIHAIVASGKYPDHIVHLPACKMEYQRFPKCAWQDYQAGMDVSLRSIVLILQSFLPVMAKKKSGKIIFMLSSCVNGIPPKFQSPYVTTKYALLGLMKSLSAEYAERGITVNAISPDMMETKFLAGIPELIIEQNAKNSPMGRNIKIDEVIPAFVFLLSEEANAVTGQNFSITGGIR